ncbi:MAG TPA: hypothetical protein VHG29_01750 [Novosphingobium sp.]|nr:hypothetical protein [Novosphingobium sp.]
MTGIFGKRLAGGALVALALGAAMPAAAQTAYYPVPGGPQTPISITLAIPVRASIGGSCNFATAGAPNGTYNIPGFIDVNSWTNDFTMQLVCTGPSRMAIVSTNGGLLSSASATTGYANLAPYDVAVNIVQGSGGPTTGNCPAANLKSSSAAACTLRGTASPTVGLPFGASVNLNGSYVRVSAPAFPGPDILVAGSYTDTLTITVSPAS